MPPRNKNPKSSIFPPPKLPCEERVERLAEELRGVRASIRVMSKQVARARSAWVSTPRVKQQAALVYELCRDTKWAIVFVRLHQQAHMHRTTRMPWDTTPTMIMDWWHQVRLTADFEKARRNVQHVNRVKVDEFLMESVLYEYVVEQSRLQLVVPSSTIMAKHMTAWVWRPMSEDTAKRLQQMRDSPALRRNWLYRFRQKWNLAWGVAPPGKPITLSEMKRKVHVTCCISSFCHSQTLLRVMHGH